MYSTLTTIHNVRGLYWDRSEECLHLHIVSDEGMFELNLFHDKAEQPEVVQATVTGSHNPASRMADAAAERLKKRLDNSPNPA